MKMKKYIYTIGLLLAILLPAGCTDADLQETQQVGSDADKVYLRIGLTMPEAQMVQSRSFDRVDDTPNHQNFAFTDLHVAVFVKQGDTYILEEFVSAEGDNKPEWDGDSSDSNCPGSGHWDFGVNLTKREGPRRLHFIANYPGLTMGFGEESGLIGRLLTDETLDAKGEHDIYWNYMDVPSIQEGTQERMRNIPMLRNFAKVEIELTPKQGVNLNDKFKLIRYAIHNKPKKGTAAPYNSSDGSFANYVVKNGTSMSCQTYEHLEKRQGYVGNEPYDNEYQKLTDFNAVTYNSDGTITAAPFYLYERTHVGADDPTCIILEGKYAANGNFNDPQVKVTYYKLDFVHRDENTSTNVYYNLLRNFIYTMNIVDVSGAGYNTVDDAIRNPASNNIAGNTDIEKFTNISDGDARLFVSTTYVVFTDEEPIDIYYQYIPDLKNNPTVHNNNLKGISGGEIVVSTPTKEVLESRDVADSDETTGHVGWRKITLTPKAGFNGRKVEYLTIASSTLQRKITIVRRNPYPMDIYAYDPNDQDKLVAKTAKSEVDVKVRIEGGIPEALFPLKFYVTSDENSIYAKPGGDMYSESFDGGYGFVKEITWDFYKNANATGTGTSGQPVGIKEANGDISFICNFLTNCTKSATSVSVYNEYFNTGTDYFENPKVYNLEITTEIFTHGVKVQQETYTYGWNRSASVYPRKIHNKKTQANSANTKVDDGTETVDIFYKNEPKGKIIIDKDNVLILQDTSGNPTDKIVLNDPNGIEELEFKFRDYYCTGLNLSGYVFQQNIDGYNFNNQADYKAILTIDELLGGEQLNFVRQSE